MANPNQPEDEVTDKVIEAARKMVEAVATDRGPYRQVDARLFAAGVLLICHELRRPLTPEEAFGPQRDDMGVDAPPDPSTAA